MDAEELAGAALEWLVAEARVEGDGLAWTGHSSRVEVDPDLYAGSAGIVLALLEAHHHFGDDRWAGLASRGARGLAARVDDPDLHPSLHFGATGIAFVLHEVGERLDDPVLHRAAGRCLARVRDRFDGERFGEMFELMGGNAGIALGALRVGDVELAELAVEPYLRRAETTSHGVTWETRAGLAARRHHVSHGTLGVALALAVVADAVGRAELMELALAAVDDVVARNEAGASGFLVPHSDPQQLPDRIERFSYGWCHGPAGDAQVFRLLEQLTGECRWAELQDRCWRTVVGSGLPQRLRPGFWDNSGRCCGTAGVLALASDREVERGDGGGFADVLVADLVARARVDGAGARWSNHEHRQDRPELEPRQGWAMGNAGIVPELLRHARIADGRDPAYAVAWPDHPAAVILGGSGPSSASDPEDPWGRRRRRTRTR